jgi:hypothetical protein
MYDVNTLQEVPPWEWPKDAGDIFRKTLLDRKAELADRVIAANLAGNPVVVSDELTAALLTVLKSNDEPEELRGAAAISFGPALETADIDEFTEPEAVPISEACFDEVQDTLHKLYLDESLPKYVRRRILEASVRATADWHVPAIQAAYTSGDRDWMLTAVFAMNYIRGFNKEILESLESGDDDIHLEAVRAAGNWELKEAWAHVVHLIENPTTDKNLLLAAIDAAVTIDPNQAGPVLVHLSDSEDEELAEAAMDAMQMAEVMSDTYVEDEDEDEDEDGEEKSKEWLN